MLIIFDLDGTLSSNAHRVPLVHHQAPGHEEWLNQVGEDPPNDHLIGVFRSFRRANFDIRIWTARPERYRELTNVWLFRHGIRHVGMRMAPDNYRGTDTDLKRGWAQVERPDLVFEDNEDICRMYHEEGAQVVHVKPWW